MCGSEWEAFFLQKKEKKEKTLFSFGFSFLSPVVFSPYYSSASFTPPPPPLKRPSILAF
jgi:hypothetical protein